jgi:cephalosporin hydroxylase
MVILDSDHSYNHVLKELGIYSKIVTKGQYLVLEDCYTSHMTPSEVMDARNKFLENNNEFEVVDLTRQFLAGLTRDGWLLKK